MTLEAFVTRTVGYRFCGSDLRFHLSHALFSSHEVDEGSSLLLKTLAQNNILTKGSRILDVGCGTGVLGLALLKAFPGTVLTATDRDELACAFTRLNAEENNLADRAVILGGLGVEAADGSYALAVSNLPAKAGPPVLGELLTGLAEKTGPQGYAAVVIVRNLAEGLASELRRQEADILLTEEGPRHTVFHYRISRPQEQGKDSPYIRREAIWELSNIRFKYRTLWGLEDFDQLNTGRQLLLQHLLDLGQVWTTAGFWNMGQAQLPVALVRGGKLKGPLTLWDRDRLALQAAAENITQFPEGGLVLQPVAWIGEIPDNMTDGLSLMAAYWEGEPQVKQEKEAFSRLASQTATGGILAAAGPSSVLGRLLERTPHFVKIRDKREKGYRSVILRKQQG